MTIMDSVRTWPTPKKVIAGVGVPLAIVGGGLLAYDLATMTSSEDTARDSCERQVSAQAKYPGSVNFVLWGDRDPDNGDGTYTYSGTVDFANGFGTPVRHFFACKINGPGEVDSVEVVSLS